MAEFYYDLINALIFRLFASLFRENEKLFMASPEGMLSRIWQIKVNTYIRERKFNREYKILARFLEICTIYKCTLLSGFSYLIHFKSETGMEDTRRDKEE